MEAATVLSIASVCLSGCGLSKGKLGMNSCYLGTFETVLQD